MSDGLIVRVPHSVSLWNYTLSPGWTKEEAETFRKALVKFGIGNWKDIVESGCLKGKTNAQLNLQLQKMLGQQSTAEFQGLHIDPYDVGKQNAEKSGPDIKRKNGLIVNTGGKLPWDVVKRKIQENKERFEQAEEVYNKIELTVREEIVTASMIQDKQAELDRLIKEREQVELEISRRRLLIQKVP